ncbi:hypothetical protein BD414DRAFT_423697 [Trametes punicea]|nr:hypothetical protein BD414DRAFT_423697 [Trametes punicea]
MDRVPSTVLHHISELACTDGGFTGNSLSLTSRAIRGASRTARFHSVFLIAKSRRLHSFLQLYERECDPSFGYKPRIRHLYAWFPAIDKRNLYRSRQSNYSRSLSPPRKRNPNATSRRSFTQLSADAQIDPTASTHYREAARTLFRLVAPDLYTLVIQSGYRYGGEFDIPIVEDPFPFLRELTVVDVFDPRTLFHGLSVHTPLFPSATHLHLLPNASEVDLHLSLWPTVAPNVTHLRISDRLSLGQLALAVGVPADNEPPMSVHLPGSFFAPSPPPSPPPRTYPSVRYLLMQPGPRPSGGFCGTPLIEYHDFTTALKYFGERCCAAGISAVLLEPPVEDLLNGKKAEWLGREWRERIEGGQGCWRELELEQGSG